MPGTGVAIAGDSFRVAKAAPLEYKGTPLRYTYQPDLVCYEMIVVELKAVKELVDEYRAQVQNYLRATRFQLGLLVNFGHYPKVQIERIVGTTGRYAPVE
jgi:GxxExxY protein